MLQMVRIYRVQIPEVERSTLQGEDDTDVQITDFRTLYDLQITEVQMGGLLMAGLLTIQITDRKSNVVKSRDLQWHYQSHPADEVFVFRLPLEKVV